MCTIARYFMDTKITGAVLMKDSACEENNCVQYVLLKDCTEAVFTDAKFVIYGPEFHQTHFHRDFHPSS
jgi:hypothetical protein